MFPHPPSHFSRLIPGLIYWHRRKWPREIIVRIKASSADQNIILHPYQLCSVASIPIRLQLNIVHVHIIHVMFRLCNLQYIPFIFAEMAAAVRWLLTMFSDNRFQFPGMPLWSMPSAEYNTTTPDTGHRTGAPLLATTSAAAALGVGLRLSTTGSAD